MVDINEDVCYVVYMIDINEEIRQDFYKVMNELGYELQPTQVVIPKDLEVKLEEALNTRADATT